MVEKVGLNEWLAYVLKQAQGERVKGDTRTGLRWQGNIISTGERETVGRFGVPSRFRKAT